MERENNLKRLPPTSFAELLEQCELTEDARKKYKGLEEGSSPMQKLLATEYNDRDTGSGTTKTTVNVVLESEEEEDEGKDKTKKPMFEEEGISNGQRLFSSAGLGVKRASFA